MAAVLQTQAAYQFHWCIVGERLYLAVELRALQSHHRCKSVDIQVGVAHFPVEYVDETVVELVVDVTGGQLSGWGCTG